MKGCSYPLAHSLCLDELNVPGFDFHGLEGKPKRYSIHINGPYCLTFEWDDGDIYRIDLVNYH